MVALWDAMWDEWMVLTLGQNLADQMDSLMEGRKVDTMDCSMVKRMDYSTVKWMDCSMVNRTVSKMALTSGMMWVDWTVTEMVSGKATMTVSALVVTSERLLVVWTEPGWVHGTVYELEISSVVLMEHLKRLRSVLGLKPVPLPFGIAITT